MARGQDRGASAQAARSHWVEDHFVAPGSDMNGDWLDLLDEYDVQFVALDADRDGDLLKLFRSKPEWTVDSDDGQVVVFARREAACADNGNA